MDKEFGNKTTTSPLTFPMAYFDRHKYHRPSCPWTGYRDVKCPPDQAHERELDDDEAQNSCGKCRIQCRWSSDKKMFLLVQHLSFCTLHISSAHSDFDKTVCWYQHKTVDADVPKCCVVHFAAHMNSTNQRSTVYSGMDIELHHTLCYSCHISSVHDKHCKLPKDSLGVTHVHEVEYASFQQISFQPVNNIIP